jgi:hypothetical protein
VHHGKAEADRSAEAMHTDDEMLEAHRGHEVRNDFGKVREGGLEPSFTRIIAPIEVSFFATLLALGYSND